MSKVIARIKGGLGNQLFCYAAARRLAIVNGTELVIDDVTGFVRDRGYGRSYALGRFAIDARKASPGERLEPFERYRRALARCIARRKPYPKRRYVEQDGVDFDPRLLEFRVRGTVHLDGLWQSEGYFKDVEQTIREDLRITAPEDVHNREMASRIAACNAVAVHVRWFDGPGANDALHDLGPSYYASAADAVLNREAEPHFFLFSDRTDAARRMLDLPDKRVTCVSHNRGDENAYADLWLMTQCRHFIIANSTFSWWGAWLAAYQKKTVVAPKVRVSGMTAWGFRGLIPDTWMQMS